MRAGLALAACAVAIGCGAGPAGPLAITLGSDQCAHCRMAIVSEATAAQIVAPGEEPVFFDDLGCLRDYVKASGAPGDAAIFVADHRTGTWIDARQAVFTRTSVSTPMASGILAHADGASRDADAAARDGQPLKVSDVLPARTGEERP